MKSKYFIILLVFALCIAIGISASAIGNANNNSVTLSNGQSMVLTVSQKAISVTAFNDTPIAKKDIQAFYEYAQTVKAQEAPGLTASKTTSTTDCFEYTLMTDDVSFFYEENTDGLQKILLFDTVVTAANKQKATASTTRAAVNLLGGLGGRLKINQSSGAYISGRIQTPTKSQVTGTNSATAIVNYIYAGFNGMTDDNKKIESDIGLQYTLKDPNKGGWNHYFMVSIYNEQTEEWDHYGGNFLDGNKDVILSNFFLTSDSSNTRNLFFTTYKNFNDSGKIRSKVEGYAKYNNSAGTGTPGAYSKTSVVEYVKKVQSITYWKLLNTFTNESASNVSSWCKFYDLQIGTSISVNSIDKSVLTFEEDYATMTPAYSNNKLSTLTISVSK